MATIKGQHLRVFINNVAVAAAQQCDLSIRLGVKQISTKDDTDDFAENVYLRLSWEVSANGVVTIDPDRNDPTTLLDRIGQTVHVELATASGDKNSDKGETMLAGEAIISDVQIQAQVDNESTYQVTLTGKKNMLFDLREIITADNHNIRTADGHIVYAEHDRTL